jgi:hypothetical protein
VRSRLSTIVVALLALIVLGLFMVAGALDPPSRLKTRPATATTASR